MKVNVEVECTPEEARRFLGLPDLGPVHEAYVAQMLDTVKNGVSAEGMETMLKSWGPMTDVGFKFWQQMMEGMSGRKS
jgi:hypothetical protein